jgi:hypothetical protein
VAKDLASEIPCVWPPCIPSDPVYLYCLGLDLDLPVVFKFSLVLLFGDNEFYALIWFCWWLDISDWGYY